MSKSNYQIMQSRPRVMRGFDGLLLVSEAEKAGPSGRPNRPRRGKRRVPQRAWEALGAQRSKVVALIVREMAIIAAIATVIALPSIVALARLFRSQLYGVTNFEPLTLSVTITLTAAMAALAAALRLRARKIKT
jgi:predicted lysophospholipase L1 biosynthesis ABC-type transport system permease subunit